MKHTIITHTPLATRGGGGGYTSRNVRVWLILVLTQVRPGVELSLAGITLGWYYPWLVSPRGGIIPGWYHPGVVLSLAGIIPGWYYPWLVSPRGGWYYPWLVSPLAGIIPGWYHPGGGIIPGWYHPWPWVVLSLAGITPGWHYPWLVSPRGGIIPGWYHPGVVLSLAGICPIQLKCTEQCTLTMYNNGQG